MTLLCNFKEDITKVDVSIDFIMDNVTKTNMKQSLARYPLSVYAEPVINVDVNRVDDYTTVWPCTHDRIKIEVQLGV